ncbi:MAG: lycopene cyclase family protein, partial [Glaciecola sp.]
MTLRNSILNQNSHYDLILIGAGAANLSLVLALKESNYDGSVLILERTDKLPNNRIWSFWYHTTLPKHITSLISHKWASWSVSIGTSCATMNAPTMPYCSITAETLSNAALAVIDKSANYSLLLSCDVVSVEHKKNTISV